MPRNAWCTAVGSFCPTCSVRRSERIHRCIRWHRAAIADASGPSRDIGQLRFDPRPFDSAIHRRAVADIEDGCINMVGERYSFKSRIGPRTGSDITPISILNPLLGAIDAALAPGKVDGKQTLGGLVSHCWIEGKVMKDILPQDFRSTIR